MRNAGIYRDWLDQHQLADVAVEVPGKKTKISAPLPDEQGFFPRGTIRCVLPYLRVFWRGDDQEASGADAANTAVAVPPWRPETWEQLRSGEDNGAREQEGTGNGSGFVRFMRADQVLECIRDLMGERDPGALVAAIRDVMATWLIPIDEPLADKVEVIDRRVETVRLLWRGERWVWSRDVRYFPDVVRSTLPAGIDPVHTPENARAGLTRYLCDGWSVDEQGRLVSDSLRSSWGPSAGRIPHRLCDAPRRLMLGASLQSRAVSLLEWEQPQTPQDDDGWVPPGRRLRAAFSMLEGWTHEDAVVVSESCARKLGRRTVKVVRVLIPSVASRVEVPPGEAERVTVRQGQTLARAFIDVFALGLRRHDAEAQGAVDGWLEVALPGAHAPIDGDVSRVVRRVLRTPNWREMITIEIERVAPIRVGDKLSTRHGIKGVVSRILPDAEMPEMDGGPAEIVLSPLGIVRRGAMGQLREAAADDAAEVPHSGPIFVLRQPQDADVPERCRVRGPDRRGHEHTHHGQRYGEMEFWALMAHGATAIATELLSVERSTSSWMRWEGSIAGGDHRQVATRALNRYLAVGGVQVLDQRLVVDAKPPGVFDIEPKWTGSGDPRELLDDASFFRDRGGLGRLPLGRVVRVFVGDVPASAPLRTDAPDVPLGRPIPVVRYKRAGGTAAYELQAEGWRAGGKVVGFAIDVDHLYVLPPWLRPSNAVEQHQLTRAYWRVMTRLATAGWPIQWTGRMSAPLDALVADCIRLALHDSLGAGGFLRREVLGRRLTRSARAVIVPRPDLRIDQIALPEWMADRLFDGLSDASRRIVLVNRNPTLHRRGLLAMRPVIDRSNSPHVFGLPLGVLRAMGADFDGDQASVVALATDAALAEAERLLPGAAGLRSDPYRSGHPAFPFAGELADPDGELALAHDTAATQDAWRDKHHALQMSLIGCLRDGWDHRLMRKAMEQSQDLWNGLAPDAWRERAKVDMDKILRGVRRKGQLGGVLRRELYRRAYADDESFWRTIRALQAVTERMTQTALSVKTGKGATGFDARSYFDNPAAGADLLALLDQEAASEDTPLDPTSLAEALGGRAEPKGLLAWMACPDAVTLLNQVCDLGTDPPARGDPRSAWFLS